MNDVFISYSRQDQPYARALADELQRRGLSVWIDDRIEHGHQWFDEIERAIESSKTFVVIMSPRSDSSEWVRKEILLAKREHKPIFPLLLEGREFAMLIDTQFADVRNGQLPPPHFYSHLVQAAEGKTRQIRRPQPRPPQQRPLQAQPQAAPARPKQKGGVSGLAIGAIVGVVLVGICGVVALAAAAGTFGNLGGLLNNNAAEDPTATVQPTATEQQQDNPTPTEPPAPTQAPIPTATTVSIPPTAAISAADSAANFLTALGLGNVDVASQYVCSGKRSWLAQTASQQLEEIGVTAISDVECAAASGNQVACTFIVWDLSGASRQTSSALVMEGNLVCDVVGS